VCPRVVSSHPHPSVQGEHDLAFYSFFTDSWGVGATCGCRGVLISWCIGVYNSMTRPSLLLSLACAAGRFPLMFRHPCAPFSLPTDVISGKKLEDLDTFCSLLTRSPFLSGSRRFVLASFLFFPLSGLHRFTLGIHLRRLASAPTVVWRILS